MLDSKDSNKETVMVFQDGEQPGSNQPLHNEEQGSYASLKRSLVSVQNNSRITIGRHLSDYSGLFDAGASPWTMVSRCVSVCYGIILKYDTILFWSTSSNVRSIFVGNGFRTPT